MVVQVVASFLDVLVTKVTYYTVANHPNLSLTMLRPTATENIMTNRVLTAMFGFELG